MECVSLHVGEILQFIEKYKLANIMVRQLHITRLLAK